ncbi:MAG: WD40 repeat protein [Enterobacterales bacterium]
MKKGGAVNYKHCIKLITVHLIGLIRLPLIVILLLTSLSACQQNTTPLSQARHSAVATYDADISDDGKYSLIASVNHDAGLWDLENDVLLYNWSHSKETDIGIIAVDISSDGSRAVTATEKDMAVWDTQTGKNIGFYSLPESDLRDIAISDRGDSLIMGLGDGRIIHLSLVTGRRLEFLAHGEAINSLDISPNGRYVLSGANDYRALLWDSKSGQILKQWKHNSRVILVSLSRDGSKAFSAGNKANGMIWDIKTGKKISQLDLAKRQYVLSSARFSSDNKQLLTGAPSRQLILWNAKDGMALKQIRVGIRKINRPTGAIIYSVGFNAQGELLSESSAGFGERWSTTEGDSGD